LSIKLFLSAAVIADPDIKKSKKKKSTTDPQPRIIILEEDFKI
jgi:hypothetical protein